MPDTVRINQIPAPNGKRIFFFVLRFYCNSAAVWHTVYATRGHMERMQAQLVAIFAWSVSQVIDLLCVDGAFFPAISSSASATSSWMTHTRDLNCNAVRIINAAHEKETRNPTFVGRTIHNCGLRNALQVMDWEKPIIQMTLRLAWLNTQIKKPFSRRLCFIFHFAC